MANRASDLPKIIAGVLSFPMMQGYRSKLYVPR